MDRQLFDLYMERDLAQPIRAVQLPEGYSILSIHEGNGYVWESVMTKAFEEEYKPGTFRWILADNYNYEDDRVFVLLNDRQEPIATATAWHNDHMWDDNEHGSVIFVGVDPAYRAHRYGVLMVDYILQHLKDIGFTIASLNVEENNLPAIKTYLNCGFTPHIVDPRHHAVWTNQFSKLCISPPQYNSLLRPITNRPYPIETSPYRERKAQAAAQNGDIYVHGHWEKYNMYLVEPSEYRKLDDLINKEGKARELYASIRQKGAGRIFIDQPRQPAAAFLESDLGTGLLAGQSHDPRFTEGVKIYLEQ